MSQQDPADAQLGAAFATRGVHDPRELYRDRLRDLKSREPGSYDRAVAYYRDTLVPAVAQPGADPVAAWTEYGRHLAELSASGRTVGVDRTGRARPYDPTRLGEDLMLHLPERGGRALPVLLPLDPSPAQRATYELIVAGRQKLPDEPPFS